MRAFIHKIQRLLSKDPKEGSTCSDIPPFEYPVCSVSEPVIKPKQYENEGDDLAMSVVMSMLIKKAAIEKHRQTQRIIAKYLGFPREEKMNAESLYISFEIQKHVTTMGNLVDVTWVYHKDNLVGYSYIELVQNTVFIQAKLTDKKQLD